MFKKISLYLVFSILITVSLLITACGGTTTPLPATQAPSTSVPTKEVEPTSPTPAEKNVTISFLTEPDTLNPLYETSWFSQMVNLLNQANLWVYDADGNVILDLAAEYPTLDNGGLSADGKIITIKLKNNVQWSDGTPITVDDLIFTYDMVMADGNTVTRYPWDTYIDSLTKVDSQTLTVKLKEPFVDWAYSFWTKGAILPKHILEPVFTAAGSLDNAEWNRVQGVSSGPFIVTEWVAGSHIILKANENYWRGRPKLDHIYVRMIADRSTQNAALASGAADIGSYILAEDIPALKELTNVQLETIPAGYSMPLFFNLDPKTANPGMTELAVRQAIIYSLDRKQINDQLNYGMFTIPVTWWNGTVWDNPTLQPLPFDPEKAKSLLEGAGWKDTNGDGIREKVGVDLKLRFQAPQGSVDSGLAVVIQQMLGDVGIGVEIIPTTMGNLWVDFNNNGPLATGQFDLTTWGDGMWYFPSPEIAYFLCDQIPNKDNPNNINFWHVCDPKLDELFTAQKTELDQTKRIEMFQEIGKIMHDNVYITYLFDTPEIWAVNDRVQNFKLSGGYSLYNSYEWDVSQ